MPELTNTEFAAHLRVAAKMMDCEDNYGNPIVPGIVRSMRKAADIIDTDETAIAALQSENAEKDKRIARMETDIKLAASGRCCQICSRDCLGHEEITACDAFEYRGAQGVE